MGGSFFHGFSVLFSPILTEDIIGFRAYVTKRHRTGWMTGPVNKCSSCYGLVKRSVQTKALSLLSSVLS